MRKWFAVLLNLSIIALLVTACASHNNGDGGSAGGVLPIATPSPTPASLFTTAQIEGVYQTDCVSFDGYYTKKVFSLTREPNDSTNTKMAASINVQKYYQAGCLAASSQELLSVTVSAELILGERVIGQNWHKIDNQVFSVVAALDDSQVVRDFNSTKECGFSDWTFNPKTVTGQFCQFLGGQQLAQNQIVYDILSRDATTGNLTMGIDTTSKTSDGNRPTQLSSTVFKVRTQ